ncbi:hypothetical protein GCM10009682_15360 [Luedemannella flava]|uniref:Uncharacterized protein n=1 Tax=Luedemannella flava TaxID=349316 RepID=A0ABP4XTR2_9ACTN
MNQRFETPDELDAWIAAQAERLISDVAGGLDLQAGLGEILLVQEYRQFASELGRSLDVEAGLAQIVAPPPLEDAALTDIAPSTVDQISTDVDRRRLDGSEETLASIAAVSTTFATVTEQISEFNNKFLQPHLQSGSERDQRFLKVEPARWDDWLFVSQKLEIARIIINRVKLDLMARATDRGTAVEKLAKARSEINGAVLRFGDQAQNLLRSLGLGAIDNAVVNLTTMVIRLFDDADDRANVVL